MQSHESTVGDRLTAFFQRHTSRRNGNPAVTLRTGSCRNLIKQFANHEVANHEVAIANPRSRHPYGTCIIRQRREPPDPIQQILAGKERKGSRDADRLRWRWRAARRGLGVAWHGGVARPPWRLGAGSDQRRSSCRPLCYAHGVPVLDRGWHPGSGRERTRGEEVREGCEDEEMEWRDAPESSYHAG